MKSRYYYFFFYILVSRTTLAYLYFFFFNWLIHNSLNLPLLIFVLQSLKTHLIEAAQRYFLCYRWITSRYSHNPSILDRVNYVFQILFINFMNTTLGNIIFSANVTITLIVLAIRYDQISRFLSDMFISRLYYKLSDTKALRILAALIHLQGNPDICLFTLFSR